MDSLDKAEPMVSSVPWDQGMEQDTLKTVYNEPGWNSFTPTGQAMAMLDVCSFHIARKCCAEPSQGSH